MPISISIGTLQSCVLITFILPAVSISLLVDSSSLCLPFIVLQCSFSNVHFVRIEEFITHSNQFSTLTTTYISRNPDFEEMASDGIYTMRIAAAERYNGTRYRCQGFSADLSKVFHSEEWTLIIPGESAQWPVTASSCFVLCATSY